MYTTRYTTVRPVRRTRTAAAVLAVTAVMVGGAACGTDVAGDNAPAAPAQQLRAPLGSHAPTSADSAERRGRGPGQPDTWLTSPHGRPVHIS